MSELDQHPHRKPALGRLQQRVRILIPLCLLGLALPFLTRLLDAYTGAAVWAIDLLSHWQWLFVLVLVVCALIAAYRDRRWLLCLIAAPLPWFSASASLEQNKAGDPALKIITANINLATVDVQPLAHWLSEEQPDLVIVQEVSHAAAKKLDSWSEYPHRVIVPDNSPFGIALLSRSPLFETKIVRNPESTVHIEAQIDFEGRRLFIAAIHPMPPISPEHHKARVDKLKNIARQARERMLPALIAGDINATPWSTPFMRMEQLGWRRATGVSPTWPASGHGLFGIPIDHVIASPEWRRGRSTVGPQLGSDHLPVLARLSLMRP